MTKDYDVVGSPSNLNDFQSVGLLDSSVMIFRIAWASCLA